MSIEQESKQFVVAGIDIGSLTAKAVLLNSEKRVLVYAICPTWPRMRESAKDVMHKALDLAGLQASDVRYVLSTGYGRGNVDFADAQLTEITCHARGAHFLDSEVRTVIDIGGQDSKAISLDSRGKVTNFAMNDKCSAGTGRFLEVMSRALEVDLEAMGRLSLQSRERVEVSSMCTVFAESEVISLLADSRDQIDIIAGIHRAIARRAGSMVENIGVQQKVMMSGGVAKNVGVVRALETRLGTAILVPEEPQVVGALGASLLALEHVLANPCPSTA